jgi:alkanesulfonate monooxygenase SsuD/methylene tetrahydromethanopterin reductase-like flavin-dependent oxidoreductase (luciferase family)
VTGGAAFGAVLILSLDGRRTCGARLSRRPKDFAGGGSDRLVDQVLAWGSPGDVADRVREHVAAGADEVALRFIPSGVDPIGAYVSVRSAL